MKATTIPFIPKNLLLAPPHAPNDPDLHDRIALKAYRLYQERGCVDGHDCDDWLEAEKSVLAEYQVVAVPLRSRKD